MSNHYSSLVAGVADSGNSKEVTSPYNGEVIGSVSTVDGVTADLALKTAYAIYRDRNRWLSKVKRIEILEKTADIMRSRFDELAIELSGDYLNRGEPLFASIDLARKECLKLNN